MSLAYASGWDRVSLAYASGCDAMSVAYASGCDAMSVAYASGCDTVSLAYASGWDEMSLAYASGCGGGFALRQICSIDKSMDIGLGWNDPILCRKCFQAWILRIANGLFRVGR